MVEKPQDLELGEDVEINEKDRTNFRNFSYSKKDLFYRKAKEEGFRARSVYKLKEINENFNVLENVTKVIDLCAAPGSWSQMLRILLSNHYLYQIKLLLILLLSQLTFKI